MRRLATAVLAAVFAAAPVTALESPLVIGSGNFMVSIDPALGLAILMNVEQNGTKRLGWTNFIADLNRLEKTTTSQGGKAYSNLRLGSANVVPTVEGFIELFPEKPTKKEDAGKDGPRKKVRDAEEAFWEKLPAFDGKISAAFNGTYLMLAFPSRHALLFYENTNEKFEFRGCYNYGPLLYISTGWQSEPSPAKLAKDLVLDEDQRKALEGALADKEGQVVGAAPSEVWTTVSGQTFAVVDTANRLLFSLEFAGKKIQIRSVRNMSVDLMAPGYKTFPTDQDALKLFTGKAGPLLRELGITQFDVAYVKALIAATSAGEAAKESALQANMINGQLVLSFLGQHKVMTYDLSGAGNGIELKSVRDSTFDSGLATLYRLAQERQDARDAFKAAEKSSATHKTEDAQRFAEMALALDPELFPLIEKSSMLKSELGKTPGWQAFLDFGAKAFADAKAKKEAIEAAAKAERERKAAKKAAK